MNRLIAWLAVGWSPLLFASENGDQIIPDNLLVLPALFLLGFVGIIILFISSRQMMKIEKFHQKMIQKQEEMEQGQTSLIANMSEKIFEITKDTIESRDAILKDSKECPIEKVLEQVIKAENTLLDRTNDLIDFLRLKSKKVEIVNEPFNFNNVLNEVSGLVCTNFRGTQTELIFDIDNRVPRFLIGDSLHLGQILTNLLDYSLSQTIEGEIKLEISIFQTYKKRAELQFQIIDTSAGMDSRSLEKLFVPYYDEETKEYTGLGLFVADQLVNLMGGEMTAQSHPNRGTTFTFVLPLQIVDPDNRRRYRLSKKILTTKKVFIVDSNYNSALAIKKMFAYFQYDVKVISKEQFTTTRPNLTEYDIVVLDEELFNPKVVEYLKKIKKDKELRIIGVGSLLRPVENEAAKSVVDRHLKKPLNQERIFELIENLYQAEIGQVPMKEREESRSATREEVSSVAHIHKEPIPETKNIVREQFSDFSGAKLLIVEDNLINQKVLITILDKSGIEVTTVDNGEQALMMVISGKIAFDLVLMDINMPVMDGYTATESIRATGKFDDLPIVSFTALVLDSEVEKMFSAGVNAFLAKPLNIGKLYTVFDMFVGSKTRKLIDNKPKVFEQKIDGIDIQEGIKHANGSEALYMEVLAEFVEVYEGSGILFQKLIDENRYEQIKMLCLDMKGLAGTIGAHDMHQKVDEIYKLFIYGNQSFLPSFAEEYRGELEKLLGTIRIYLDGK